MTPPHDHRFHVLDNGLRIVTERIPDAQSISFGIWIEAGSRHEAHGQEGMAHLWEHLAFKGTNTRSALHIAKSLDMLGGHSNAYTSREHTCFHARVRDTHLETALDILSDIVLSPKPSEEDFEREKDVVLQEIAMVEDDPEESLMDAFWTAIWPDSPAGHPILGLPDTVRAFTLADMRAWRAVHYRPESILIAGAGSLDHEGFQAMVHKRFGTLVPGGPLPARKPDIYRPATLLTERDIEQTHVALSFPAPGGRDERRFAVSILNAVLGGTMSSRLFQEVRERRGLAYSVYSFINSLADAGALQVYAAVDPQRAGELLACVRDELDRMAGQGITQEELEHARDHMLSVLYLSLEASEDRMSRLARNQLTFGRYVPPEESAARFEAVTLEDVRALAAALLNPAKAGLAVLGPVIDPGFGETVLPARPK